MFDHLNQSSVESDQMDKGLISLGDARFVKILRLNTTLKMPATFLL